MSVKKYTDATGVAEIWAKVKSIIPSKTSDLTNDSSFITLNDVPTEVYWATYGTTTSAQIDSALSDGKMVAILDSGNNVFYLSTVKTSSNPSFNFKRYHFSRTYLNAVFTYELAVNLDTGTETWNSLSNTMLTQSGVLDIFYPVGSYYETSDINFDPNVSWGGVWVLETAGIVHVSAGTGWAVNGAPTNTKDGGNKDSIVPYHTHSYTKPPASTDGFTLKATHLPAHTHGSETLTGQASIHSDVGVLGANASLSGIFSKGSSVSTSYRPNWTSGASYKLKVDATHTHNSVGGDSAHSHGITNTSANVGYPSGTSSGNTTGANMPPYIKVNRWHRMPDNYVAS